MIQRPLLSNVKTTIHNIVGDEEIHEYDDDFTIGNLHWLDTSTEPIWTEPEVEANPPKRELDTCSAYSNEEIHEYDDDFTIGNLHWLDTSAESIWTEPEVEAKPPKHMFCLLHSSDDAEYKERFSNNCDGCANENLHGTEADTSCGDHCKCTLRISDS